MKKIKVKLLIDGSTWVMLGKVNNALKKAGMIEEAKAYMEEARQGDYNNLLMITMKYIEVV